MRRLRLKIVMSVLFVFGALSMWLAPAASALGAAIYRTDSNGNNTSTVFKVGSTGPACCCVTHWQAAIKTRVRVCYLPIP